MFDMRAKMFNRRAAGPKSMPDAVIRDLGLGPGQTVIDVGSGGGYFSLRFAKAVGSEGLVYAVDTNPTLLGYVGRRAAGSSLSNLHTVITDGFPSSIPDSSASLAFIRNVYHHLDDPASYFTRMRRLLKPGGKVVIIDYRDNAGGFSFHSLFEHSVSAADVEKDMKAAGFKMERSFDYLPEQYFMVFTPA